MHGDALCTDDRPYQRLRATVRDVDWQRRFLALSVAQRRALAGAARDGQPRAHRGDRIRHRRCESAKRRARPARRPAHRRSCTAIRTGRAFIPSRSTAGLARASCSATGIPRGACCAGTRAARSCAPCRAMSAVRRAGVKPEHRVAAHDELRLELGEGIDARRRVDARRVARGAAPAPDTARNGVPPPRADSANSSPAATAEHGPKAAKRSHERASMKAPQIMRSTSRSGSLARDQPPQALRIASRRQPLAARSRARATAARPARNGAAPRARAATCGRRAPDPRHRRTSGRAPSRPPSSRSSHDR